MKASKLYLCLAVLSLFSCSKEIPYTGDQEDPKLVLESFVFEGDSIKARVDHSVFFLDNEQDGDFMKNVSVQLILEDDVIIGPISVNENAQVFTFPVVADASKTYRINVSHDNYTNITAESKAQSALPALQLISTSKREEVIFEEGNEKTVDSILSVKFRFNDPAGINGLLLNAKGDEVFKQGGNEFVTPDVPTAITYYFNEASAVALSFEEAFIENGVSSSSILIYELPFDGTSKDLTIELVYSRVYTSPNYMEEKRKENLVLKYGGSSESAVKYLFSVSNSTGGDFFVEPVTILNAIENGIGAFGVFSQAELKL